MKLYYKLIFLISCLSFFFLSCSDDNNSEELKDEFEIDDNLTTFEETGGVQSIQLISSSEWTANSDQTWCKISPSSGKQGIHTLKVSVESNADYDERNASVLLTMDTHQKRLTVTQKQKNALLLSSNKKEVPADGGDITLEVKANVDYSYAIDEASIEWIVPVAKSGRGLTAKTLSFKVKENVTEQNRQGHIYIVSGDLKETFSVFQAGLVPELLLTENKVNVNAEGEEIKVELRSNMPYDIVMPDVDWIKKSTSRSTSTYTHYFLVSPNENYEGRSADIIFKQQTTGLSAKLTVSQLQRDVLNVDTSDRIIPVEGGSLIIEAESNVAISANANQNWIHLTTPETKALTNTTFLFKVDKNTENVERTGSVTLKAGKLTQEIKVVQQINSSIEITSKLEPFGPDSEIKTFSFTAKNDWKIRTTQPWCKALPASGSAGDHVIRVAVDDITAVPERTDTIYIQSGSVTEKVPVVQRNKDALIVMTPDLTCPSGKDTTIVVKLKSAYGVKYTIDKDAENWILPLKSRSLVDSEIEFMILKNEDVLNREGKITFTSGTRSQVFKITQKGLGLRLYLSQESFEINGKQTKLEVTVTANFKYKVWPQEHADWITVEKATELPSESSNFKTYKYLFNVEENLELDTRIVYVYFLNTEYRDEFGQVETNKIRVIQKSNSFIDIEKNEYHFDSRSQEFSFNVTADTKYKVDIPSKWIHQIAVKDLSEMIKSYTFKLDRNSDVRARIGQINLTNGYATKTITIKQEGIEDYGISIDKLPEPFTSAGGQQTITFMASGPWEVTLGAKWFTVTPLKGAAGQNTMVIKADPNKTFDQRKSDIVFKCGEHYKQIFITQGQEDHLEVDNPAPVLAWNTTKFNLKVRSNCQYTMQISPEAKWIKRANTSRALVDSIASFILEKNEGEHKREALITFKYKNLTKQVKLTQNALDSLVITEPSKPIVTFANQNDTIITVKVVGTGKVDAKIDPFAGGWILPYQPSRGLSHLAAHEFKFKILKNQLLNRKGAIMFTNGSKTTKLTIDQKGYGLQMNLNPTKVEVNSVGKEFEVSVASNFNYKIEFTNKWVKEVTATPDKPAGKAMSVNKKHRFVIEANPTTSDRELDIIFKNTDYVKELGEVSKFKVHVLQKAKEEIRVPKEAYTVPAKGQDIIFDAESNAQFKVKTTADWLRYEPQTRGFSKTNLKFVVAQSFETKPREAFIVLTSPLAEKKIKVTQEAFDDYGIRLIGDLKEFAADGGEQNLQFDSSRDWVITSIEDWCQVATSNGSAGLKNSVSIKVTANPDFSPRSTKLVLQSKSGKELITIKQAAQVNKIEVPTAPQKVAWDTKELKIMVKANCKYSITSSEAWIKVKPAATKALAQKEEIFELEPNKGTVERSATITFSAEGVKKNVTVTQGIETKKK